MGRRSGFFQFRDRQLGKGGGGGQSSDKAGRQGCGIERPEAAEPPQQIREQKEGPRRVPCTHAPCQGAAPICLPRSLGSFMRFCFCKYLLIICFEIKKGSVINSRSHLPGRAGHHGWVTCLLRVSGGRSEVRRALREGHLALNLCGQMKKTCAGRESSHPGPRLRGWSPRNFHKGLCPSLPLHAHCSGRWLNE